MVTGTRATPGARGPSLPRAGGPHPSGSWDVSQRAWGEGAPHSVFLCCVRSHSEIRGAAVSFEPLLLWGHLRKAHGSEFQVLSMRERDAACPKTLFVSLVTDNLQGRCCDTSKLWGHVACTKVTPRAGTGPKWLCTSLSSTGPGPGPCVGVERDLEPPPGSPRAGDAQRRQGHLHGFCWKRLPLLSAH